MLTVLVSSISFSLGMVANSLADASTTTSDVAAHSLQAPIYEENGSRPGKPLAQMAEENGSRPGKPLAQLAEENGSRPGRPLAQTAMNAVDTSERRVEIA